MAALIRKLVAVVAAAAARLHPRPRRRALERRLRRRLPDPDPARRGRVRRASGGIRWPAWPRLRRRRRDLRGQPPHHPDRRACITEITNEAIGASPAPTPLTIVANYYFSDRLDRSFSRSSLTVVTERIVEPRLGPVEPGRTAAGGCADRPTRPTADGAAARGPAATRCSAFLGARRPWSLAAHAAARRAAARPGDRRHLRRLRRSWTACCSSSRCSSWSPASATAWAPGRSRAATDVDQRGHEDLRRPGRPGLHAADDQPVHRLLQLQQHAERARRSSWPSCSRRPASARCRC